MTLKLHVYSHNFFYLFFFLDAEKKNTFQRLNSKPFFTLLCSFVGIISSLGIIFQYPASRACFEPSRKIGRKKDFSRRIKKGSACRVICQPIWGSFVGLGSFVGRGSFAGPYSVASTRRVHNQDANGWLNFSKKNSSEKFTCPGY